jgi:hypothetical protein
MDDYIVRNHCGLITDTNYWYSETLKNSVVIQSNYQLFKECIPHILKESYPPRRAQPRQII